MAPVQIVTFLTGFETSAPPQTSNPSGDDDAVSKGYADSTYTPKAQVYGYATNLTALKAIAPAARFNNQYVILASTNSFYKFNSASAATPDDDEVVQPDTGTGRWIKSNPPSGGGGSGSGAAGIETLEQKVAGEKYGVFTPPISNSIGESFAQPQPEIDLWLMEDYVDPATSVMMAINPTWLESANKNFDGVTGWTAITGMDTTNIDAETTTKYLGASALSWDKAGGGGGNVSSGLQIDISATPLNLASHLEALLIFNLPVTTNFSNLKLRISNDSDVETNYREYTLTTVIGGANINASTGRKNILFDLSGGSNVGAGWDSNELVNSIGFVTTWASAAQAATNLIIDSLVFNLTEFADVVQKGDEFSIYDNANTTNLQISDATASVRGLVTLSAALGNNYAGGTSSVIKRSNMDFSSENVARMVDGLSGDAAKLQTFRKKLILPASLSGQDFSVSVARATNLAFEVSTVDSTTQIKVIDPDDNSGQFKSGDQYYVFRPIFAGARKNYSYRSLLLTLSADATHSSGLTTIQNSATNSGIQPGDLICKKEEQVWLSLVAEADDEDFGSELAADDLFMSDFGIIYPKVSQLYAHWPLGGAKGLVNKRGPGANLSEAGGPTARGASFMNGAFGAGPWVTGGDRFHLALGTADELLGDAALTSGIFSSSFWFYPISTPSGSNVLLSHTTSNLGGNSWSVQFVPTTGNIEIYRSGGTLIATIPGASIPNGSWHHIAIVWDDGNELRAYANGTKITGTAPVHVGDASGSMFTIGDSQAGGNQAANAYLADLGMWTPYKFTDSDVVAIGANGSGGGLLGEFPVIRIRSTKTGLTGDKATIKVSGMRQTDDVQVSLWFAVSTRA